MKNRKLLKYFSLAICAIIITMDVAYDVKTWPKMHEQAAAYVSHTNNTNRLDYYLSQATTADDSLYVIFHDSIEKEFAKKEPSRLHEMLYFRQNAEEIANRARYELFLTHASDSDDSTFVEKTMLAPFKWPTPKCYTEEGMRRIEIMKKYFNLP